MPFLRCMWLSLRCLLALALASLWPSGRSLLAQAPPPVAQPPAPATPPTPPPVVNVLGGNGGFENVARTIDNLWDGVDGDGYLAVRPYTARVLTEGSALGNLAMPPSVAWVDLSGDGKPDLVVADPMGYYYYYQNRGTAAAPQFTNAEVLPLYLSISPNPRPYFYSPGGERDDQRFYPRMAFGDWRKRGVYDLLVGNFLGEILFVPNTGAFKQPAFAQPAPIDKARLQTTEKNRFWGNLFAPAAADWNGDGRLDLILGEGTYSANAVHLLENVGAETPRFTDAKHTRIAYGEGREHLIPTVVDYNGDGNPDLLVADRSGEVGVYLSPGPVKPGQELARTSTLSFGGTTKLPGLVTLCAGDFNGDGLFDLILGMPSGRIAVALNTGAKGQPAFGAPQEIKGADRLARNVKVPADWEIYTDTEYGNAYAYASVVNAQDDPAAQPPEGANCLKARYWPSASSLFPYPAGGIPQAGRHFTIVRSGVTLDVNKTYLVSFKVKGSGMEKLRYNFYHRLNQYVGPVKVERDDRGANVRIGERVAGEVNVSGDFAVTSDWTTVNKPLRVQYTEPALKDRTQMTGSFFIDFYARGTSSVLYLDDVKVLPTGK